MGTADRRRFGPARPDAELGPAGDLPAFDASGLPAGELSGPFFAAVLGQVEEQAEQAGWDRPAQLLAVTGPAHATAAFDFGDLPEPPWRDQADSPGRFSVPYLICTLGTFGAHPGEALLGFTAPEWAAAVVLVVEAWATLSLPVDPAGAPIEDPARWPAELAAHTRAALLANLDRIRAGERVELRIAQAVTRSGRHFMLSRYRGGEAFACDSEPQVSGFVPDLLRRTLGLDLDTPARPVTDMFAALVAAAARTAASSLVTPRADRQEDAAPAGQPPAAVADALHGLAPDARRAVLGELAVRCALQAAERVAWEGTGHGEQGVPRQDRRRLRDLAHGRVAQLTDADLVVLVAAAHAAAETTWTRLAADRHGRALLPDRLVEHAEWAGDALLSQIVCSRMLDDPADLLAELAGSTSRAAADTVAGVLEAVGWLPRAEAQPA